MEITELKSTSALTLEAHFEAFEQTALEWNEKAKLIIVEDASQTDLMKQARECRLALRNIRLAVEAKHKELKADALRYSQLLDGIKRKLVGLIEPTEEHLLTQEKFAEIQEEKQKQQLRAERIEALRPFIGAQAELLQLGDMDESVFQNLLKGYQTTKEEKERKEIEEHKRIEEQKKKDAEERERIRIEAKRQQEEQFKIDQEKKLLEANKRKFEREQQEAEEKRIAAEKEKLKEERKAKRLPDNKKLLAWAEQIQTLPMPDLKDEEAKQVAIQAKNLLIKTATFINTKVAEL